MLLLVDKVSINSNVHLGQNENLLDISLFAYPLVEGFQDCTVNVNNVDLTVSCQFDNFEMLGYAAVVQSAMNLTDVIFGETINTPVQFGGLSSGQYNVVVFPLQSNGIIGRNVAHMEQIIID